MHIIHVQFTRDKVKKCRLVANPGCYPTAAQLPLVPLLQAKLIQPDDIIIDAKSGTTGAGRSPKQVRVYVCSAACGRRMFSLLLPLQRFD